MCSADIFLGLLAILFPPLPVWVKRGICSADSIINILLCMLGWIPGLLHAWYIIAKFPEPESEYTAVPRDSEGGRVTYVYVHADDRQGGRQQPKPAGGMNYGTASTNAAASNSNAASSSGPAAPAAKPQAPAANDNGGEGRSEGPPPSYAQVVAGDHKVQSQE